MKTFLDSGVLLTAWRGRDPVVALSIMDDPKREFCTSQLVKLELLPKATFFKQHAELKFYQIHFDTVVSEEPLSRELGADAHRLARRYNIAAMDSLHIAAAIRQEADEFFTTEKTGKPMFRVKEIEVRSILDISLATSPHRRERHKER